MKKLILFLSILFSVIAFSDTYLEDYLEDLLEVKYEYISDGKSNLKLDIDVDEFDNEVFVKVKIDEKYRSQKNRFNKSVYNETIRQIEADTKKEVQQKANGKKVTIRSLY